MAAIYALRRARVAVLLAGLDEAGAADCSARRRMAWLLVLGAFMVVSWIADRWAQSDTSPAMQYAGLSLYVLAEAVIFLPLLALAKSQTVNIQGVGDVSVIPAAGVTTLDHLRRPDRDRVPHQEGLFIPRQLS